MEKTEQRAAIISEVEKGEINWAKYLDHTRFFEPAELNNILQELFKEDFEQKKIIFNLFLPIYTL